MPTLDVHITESVIDQGGSALYVVTLETEFALGIPPEVFVYRSDDVFSHVASVYDLNTYFSYPVPGFGDPGFFRKTSVRKEFVSKPDAVEFRTYTQGRLQRLVVDWQGDQTTAFGEETTVRFEGTP